MEKIKKYKIVYLELIRIIALFMIMWNHTYENGFSFFTESRESSFYMLYIALSVICKAGAPLFFMVSGALLLGRQESITVIFKKRSVRIVIIIFLYSICYTLYFGMDVQDFWKYVFVDCVTESEWFLLCYLSFLFILPFLQRLVANMRNTDFIWLMCLAVVEVTVFPIVEYFGNFQINTDLKIDSLLQWNILYPIMGYFWGKRIEDKRLTMKSVWIVNLIGLLMLVVCSALVGYRLEKDNVFLDGLFHRNGLPIIVVAIFWFIRYIGTKIKTDIMKTIITEIGKCTFGVFLLEPVLRKNTEKVCFYCTVIGMNQIVASVVWIVVAMSVGIGIVWCVKKIPYVDRIL